MLKNQTNSQIVTHALRGADAVTKTGAMSTDAYRVGHGRYTPYQGQLPKVWARILSDAFQAGRISQVIYSYSTPIAWHDSELGWIIPSVRYSATTSIKHQTHLYRLNGRRVHLPYDATFDDAQRVLSGRMGYRYDPKGNPVATVPGPNYIAGE